MEACVLVLRNMYYMFREEDHVLKKYFTLKPKVTENSVFN